MSLFVEVNSVEKGCPVIINLDLVVEIVPLAAGGCALFTADNAGVNSKSAMRVTNSYDEFKQFAIQPVSVEDVQRITSAALGKGLVKETNKSKSADLEIPKF
jgi:hypothetical protein